MLYAHGRHKLSHGAKYLIMEPNDSCCGDRFYKVSDPGGHEWMFAKEM